MRIINENNGDEIRNLIDKYAKYLKKDNYDELFGITDILDYDDTDAVDTWYEDRQRLLEFLYYTAGVDVVGLVTSIPVGTFAYFKFPEQFRKVVFSPKTQYVGNNAFQESNIKGIDFSKVKGHIDIDSEAFEDCKNLRWVTLPETLTKIPPYTFTGCYRLDTVIIPPSVKEIHNTAFNGCEDFTVVTTHGSCAEKFFEENDHDVHIEYRE